MEQLQIVCFLTTLQNYAQPLWVGFSGPKNVPSSCTHLGPAQVMEVIIIDVQDFWQVHFRVITSN